MTRPVGRPEPVEAALLPGGGSWLRIVLALVALLTMFELWVPGQAGGQIFLQAVLMASIGVGLVLRPGSAAPAILLIGALCLRIFLGRPELDGSLVALVVLLPAVHQLAALAAVVPVRSDVYWSALLPTALRYLGAVSATLAGLVVSHVLGWW